MVTLSGGLMCLFQVVLHTREAPSITWAEASWRPRMVVLGVGAGLAQVIGRCRDKGAAAWVHSGGLGTVSDGRVAQCLPESACDKCLLNTKQTRECLVVVMPVGGHMCGVLGVRHLGAGFTGPALQAARWRKEVPAS